MNYYQSRDMRRLFGRYRSITLPAHIFTKYNYVVFGFFLFLPYKQWHPKNTPQLGSETVYTTSRSCLNSARWKSSLLTSSVCVLSAGQDTATTGSLSVSWRNVNTFAPSPNIRWTMDTIQSISMCSAHWSREKWEWSERGRVREYYSLERRDPARNRFRSDSTRGLLDS